MDRGLAYLQLVLGISALTFVILALLRLFTQISFDPEPGSNYGYYFISFTLSLIAFAFGTAYVSSGAAAVVLFKLQPHGARFTSVLLKVLLFNAIVLPCLFVQLLLSLIGLFYYVTSTVMRSRDAELKQVRLHLCAVGFGANLLFCAALGSLAVRLIRRAFRLGVSEAAAAADVELLAPGQPLLCPHRPASPTNSSTAGAGFPSNGNVRGLENYHDDSMS